MGKDLPLPTALNTERYGQILVVRHQQNSPLILECLLTAVFLRCWIFSNISKKQMSRNSCKSLRVIAHPHATPWTGYDGSRLSAYRIRIVLIIGNETLMECVRVVAFNPYCSGETRKNIRVPVMAVIYDC